MTQKEYNGLIRVYDEVKRRIFAREDMKEKMLIRPYKWDLLNETN